MLAKKLPDTDMLLAEKPLEEDAETSRPWKFPLFRTNMQTLANLAFEKLHLLISFVL